MSLKSRCQHISINDNSLRFETVEAALKIVSEVSTIEERMWRGKKCLTQKIYRQATFQGLGKSPPPHLKKKNKKSRRIYSKKNLFDVDLEGDHNGHKKLQGGKYT